VEVTLNFREKDNDWLEIDSPLSVFFPVRNDHPFDSEPLERES